MGFLPAKSARARRRKKPVMTRNDPAHTTSALRVAQYVFTRSACEPTTLWLDGADFDGLPDGRLLLVPLRDLLLRPETSAEIRDAVWRELICRARTKEAWLVAALGMAMPGLRRAVRQLTAGSRVDRDDLESAMAEGFVAALHRIDLGDPSLCARLVTAARKAGVKHLYQSTAAETAGWSQPASQAPRPPWGHPDFVLLDAVAAGVVSMGEAQLIGATRLERIPVTQLAQAWGLVANTLVQRRRRAEERLREAIAAGAVVSRFELTDAAVPLPNWSDRPTDGLCDAV
jgi:hypothetical protein